MSLSTHSHTAIRGLTYVSIAAALVLAGVAAPVQAAPDKATRAPLPAAGETFNLDASSDGLEFTINGEPLTGPPMRGTLVVSIEANPSDPKQLSVEAKPSDLRLSTKAVQTHSITVTQDNAIVDEKSMLRLVKPNPVEYQHVMALDLTFSITMPNPVPAEARQVLLVETAVPALLQSSLKSFPPQNAAYSLAEPVRLVPTDNVAGPMVVLAGFDVIVNAAA